MQALLLLLLGAQLSGVTGHPYSTTTTVSLAAQTSEPASNFLGIDTDKLFDNFHYFDINLHNFNYQLYYDFYYDLYDFYLYYIYIYYLQYHFFHHHHYIYATTTTTTAAATTTTSSSTAKRNRRGNIAAIIFVCCLVSVFAGVAFLHCYKERALSKRIAARELLKATAMPSEVVPATRNESSTNLLADRSSVMLGDNMDSRAPTAQSNPINREHDLGTI
ncbi:uncharacterized protein N7483_013032 [Penicillium malachiteum]|uniref:uncharacterized protein n=1 Tax=Penicillium malachiteum TaxID=1324776 RepID=UPI002548586F|nr:uncharacterized protein N7483_013032 [Penicillium malachiteum]KAJ5715851.1 hypothetical protein N7483_013032 [Penicillium malachiteum]